jgi:hypothetical protein
VRNVNIVFGCVSNVASVTGSAALVSCRSREMTSTQSRHTARSIPVVVSLPTDARMTSSPMADHEIGRVVAVEGSFELG